MWLCECMCVTIHNKCMHMKHINCIQICTCIRISGGYSVWYSVPCPVYKQHTQYWSYFHMLSGFMRRRHKYICFPTHTIVVIWKLKCPPTSDQQLFIELLIEIFLILRRANSAWPIFEEAQEGVDRHISYLHKTYFQWKYWVLPSSIKLRSNFEF